MNLHHLLQGRAAAGRPVRIALIGAGKFGSMFLAQARLTPGFHVTIVADLNVAKAREAFATTGWQAEQVALADLGLALKSGATWVRSVVHTSGLQSLMGSSYAVFCLKQKHRHLFT